MKPFAIAIFLIPATAAAQSLTCDNKAYKAQGGLRSTLSWDSAGDGAFTQPVHLQ
jgi:hypothetical protein